MTYTVETFHGAKTPNLTWAAAVALARSLSRRTAGNAATILDNECWVQFAVYSNGQRVC